MLIDTPGLAYLNAVAAALTAGKDLDLTSVCPECGEEPVPHDNDHMMAMASGNGWIIAVVVVGCEGYWAIDPRSVGIDAPNWQPPS